ncbi:RUS family member 1 isoform X5 [Mirounga angustirostris]|uniref:RUS family member 1 isoform X5 n=1 Tax=Mirounga angustirostris TaxID=9716 RepID=UPI00313EC0B8
MADGGSPAAQLCSEQFGSGAARGCLAAADGSLQWEAWGWRCWGFSGPFTVKPPGRDGGAGGTPGAASPPLSGLTAVFLPQGFPDSVSPDYLPYQLWDSVQAFASSLSGSLATHAVLLGIGVGNEKASVSAATATWLMKDSTGMLGRIIFAWWKGSKLDCNAKQWRLFADILNDVAMFLEIMAPIYPVFFTMTVCTSNLAKCIVSVAGGATRAALTMHQARRNNMADVSAKDSSQVIRKEEMSTTQDLCFRISQLHACCLSPPLFLTPSPPHTPRLCFPSPRAPSVCRNRDTSQGQCRTYAQSCGRPLLSTDVALLPLDGAAGNDSSHLRERRSFCSCTTKTSNLLFTTYLHPLLLFPQPTPLPGQLGRKSSPSLKPALCQDQLSLGPQ